MIVFDLRCAGGHVFEAWFGSGEEYDDQAARGLVACPLCGDLDVVKALMAPHVGAKGNSEALPDATKVKAMLGALAEAQGKALEGSTWVGPRFAEEARAIHGGEVEHKPIHGQATLTEARKLAEDGVPVSALPFPVRAPNSDN